MAEIFQSIRLQSQGSHSSGTGPGVVQPHFDTVLISLLTKKLSGVARGHHPLFSSPGNFLPHISVLVSVLFLIGRKSLFVQFRLVPLILPIFLPTLELSTTYGRGYSPGEHRVLPRTVYSKRPVLRYPPVRLLS